MTREELRSIRSKLGLSQAELARALGVHPNTLACWERGDKEIGNPDLVRLALQQIEQQDVNRPRTRRC